MRFSSLVPLGALAALLFVGSCGAPPPAKEIPKIPATDTRPIGDGLRVIGYSVLGAAVVITVGRVFRSS